MKYGIFYGSHTVTTADVAKKIAAALGVAESDIHNVADTAPDKLGDYDVIVLGTSTWGNGEIEDDWYDFLDGAQPLDLSYKKMALFGCGDETMTDTFCNGVHDLYKRMKRTGAKLIGKYTAVPFKFDRSESVDSLHFALGLLLDEVNHADLTDARISDWAAQVRKEAEA